MLSFHNDLLADEERTTAYRTAIHQLVRPGDVVLDLGAGSGILSFFACEAGARRVFAIEQQQSAAGLARFLTHRLHLDGRIEILNARSSAIDLPEPADVLVTETLGAAGFDENILASVLDAKRRLLKTGGLIIPRYIALIAVPVEYGAVHEHQIAPWRMRRHGYDFQTLSTLASNTMYSGSIGQQTFLAAPAEILEAGLQTITRAEVSGRTRFSVMREGLLHGFAVWFDAQLSPGVQISNRPPRASSWQQAFFPLEDPVPVAPGTLIELELHLLSGCEWRWHGLAGGVPFDQGTRLLTILQ